MAERSNAAVLKTVEAKVSGGSNPSLSAFARHSSQERRRAFFYIEALANAGCGLRRTRSAFFAHLRVPLWRALPAEARQCEGELFSTRRSLGEGGRSSCQTTHWYNTRNHWTGRSIICLNVVLCLYPGAKRRQALYWLHGKCKGAFQSTRQRLRSGYKIATAIENVVVLRICRPV